MSQKGEVKFFNDQKGFGFITPSVEGGEELFVHANDCVDGQRLMQGDVVYYDDSYDDRKGKTKASNVTGGTGGPRQQGQGAGGGGGKGKGSCRQFAAGHCSYGDSCRFAHDGGAGGGGGYGGQPAYGGGGGAAYGGGGYGAPAAYGGGGGKGYGGGGGGYGQPAPSYGGGYGAPAAYGGGGGGGYGGGGGAAAAYGGGASYGGHQGY